MWSSRPWSITRRLTIGTRVSNGSAMPAARIPPQRRRTLSSLIAISTHLDLGGAGSDINKAFQAAARLAGRTTALRAARRRVGPDLRRPRGLLRRGRPQHSVSSRWSSAGATSECCWSSYGATSTRSHHALGRHLGFLATRSRDAGRHHRSQSQIADHRSQIADRRSQSDHRSQITDHRICIC